MNRFERLLIGPVHRPFPTQDTPKRMAWKKARSDKIFTATNSIKSLLDIRSYLINSLFFATYTCTTKRWLK
jgi:hypothetical protein